MRSLGTFVCLLFAFLVAAQDASAERRAALVFGADAYKLLRPLDNGGRDAARVAEILRGLDFEVTLETDRDLRRMRRALEDFEADHQGAEVALIFYAGHGVELAGENLILPIDADPTSLETLRNSALKLEELREVAVRMAPVALILIDACREDPFGVAPGAMGRGGVRLAPAVAKEVRPGLGRMGDARNTLFAFSTAPGALAADGAENSPFTLALAKYLATPGIEIRSALTLVQQEVYDSTSGQQLPYIENGLPQLYFVGAPASGDLPERERLLLAMAGFDSGLRLEIEATADQYQVPLATLYGAVLAAGLEQSDLPEQRAGLIEAAESYLRLAQLMRSFAASDPEVQALREKAEERLRVGALQEALVLVREARALDAGALADIGRVRIERTLSSAGSARLEAEIARTGLDRPAAIAAMSEAEALYRSIETEDLGDESHFERVRMLFDLGYLHLLIGQSGAALTDFDAMLRAAEVWLDQGSEDLRAPQQQARALMALAHVHTERAELDPALVALGRAYALVVALVGKYPGEASLYSDLRGTLVMQGDLERRSGQLEAAALRYAEAVDVAEAELGWAADQVLGSGALVTALTRLGDAQWAIAKHAAAEASYRRAGEIARALLSSAPGNLEYRRGVIVALMPLGALLREAGSPEALELYYEARALSGQTLADDPQNARAMADHQAALAEVSATLIRFGRAAEAVEGLKEALVIGKHLAALDLNRSEWQRALALTYLNLAEAGDAPLSNLLAGRGVLVRLQKSGRMAPHEAALLALFDQALRDLERGAWPPPPKPFAQIGGTSAEAHVPPIVDGPSPEAERDRETAGRSEAEAGARPGPEGAAPAAEPGNAPAAEAEEPPARSRRRR